MKRLSVIIIMILLPPLLAAGRDSRQSQDPQQDRIVEKVEVTNVTVPVRVFYKGKPVKGLKKEDFKLFENGKEKDIRVFYETDRKIVEKDAARAAGTDRPPRLFLLTFNVGDHRIDLKKAVEPFFKDILRVGDRLMVLSNSFFLNDRVVFDPVKERRKVEHILDVEKVKARWRYTQMEIIIGQNFGDLYVATTDPSNMTTERDAFIREYLMILRAFRKSFINFDNERYMRLANYLKKQDIEKWVLNFFQQNRFITIKSGSGFDAFLSGSGQYMELISELYAPLETEEADFSRLFLNTGASFHTILLGTENKKYKLTDSAVTYSAIAATTETLLREVTKLTGGELVRSNKSKTFFKKLAATEDVYYTLAYEPAEAEEARRAKIKVTVNNKDYNLVYDNQKRKKNFQKLADKVEKKVPQITLGDLYVENGVLNFPVSDFSLKPKSEGDGKGAEDGGKVRVRVSIFEPNEAKFVFDRQKEIDAKEKTLDVRIALNELESGHYRLFVEVTDLLTEKNDLGLTEIDFTGDKRI